MKTLKNVMLLFIATMTLTIISCKTDDDGGDGGNAAEGTLTAKVNGANYTSDAIGTSATLITANGIETLNINANEISAGNSNTFNITLNGVDGEGTYPIGGDAIIAATAVYIEASGDANGNFTTVNYLAPFEDAVAGEINISEITDTKVVGTFSFTARNQDDPSDEVEVTEGSFNINF